MIALAADIADEALYQNQTIKQKNRELFSLF
jgi:hypothetical protein